MEKAEKGKFSHNWTKLAVSGAILIAAGVFNSFPLGLIGSLVLAYALG